ncbi:MAG: MFS transporter [Chloroflexi bacterium]|nr:MFS transporter [Chloroflexota bacterium]
MIRDSFQLDYFRAGLLLSAFSVAYGLGQLPMAAISDRISKRLVLALGLLGAGIACIGVSIASDYLYLMLALLLMGIAGSTYHAPASAFISQAFSREARGRFLGLHLFGGTSGLMAAPLVAVFVSNITGSWRTAFFIMGLPVLVSGVLLWLVSGRQEAANRKAIALEESEPVHLMRLLKALGALVIVALLTQLLVSGMNSFLPLFMVDHHGMSEKVAGLIMAVVYGAGALAGPIGGSISDRVGRKPIILISVVGAGPMIFLATMMPFGVAMVVAIALYGAFQVFRLPAIESLIADEIPASRRATVLGGYNLLAQQATGIATPLFGWLMDQSGINAGFGLLSATALGSSLLVLALWRRI